MASTSLTPSLGQDDGSVGDQSSGAGTLTTAGGGTLGGRSQEPSHPKDWEPRIANLCSQYSTLSRDMVIEELQKHGGHEGTTAARLEVLADVEWAHTSFSAQRLHSAIVGREEVEISFGPRDRNDAEIFYDFIRDPECVDPDSHIIIGENEFTRKMKLKMGGKLIKFMGRAVSNDDDFGFDEPPEVATATFEQRSEETEVGVEELREVEAPGEPFTDAFAQEDPSSDAHTVDIIHFGGPIDGTLDDASLDESPDVIHFGGPLDGTLDDTSLEESPRAAPSDHGQCCRASVINVAGPG